MNGFDRLITEIFIYFLFVYFELQLINHLQFTKDYIKTLILL